MLLGELQANPDKKVSKIEQQICYLCV